MTKQNQNYAAEELLKEEWREIEELEGIFISNLGRMKSTRGKTEKILAICPISSPDPRKQYLGYPLKIDGRQRIFYPHRLVAKYFLPEEWYEDCQIHHIDLNKQNNRVDNLMCVSPAEHHRIHKQMRKQQS